VTRTISTPLLPSPATTRNETRRNRRPDIQGLRAIAVLVVVAFHAGLPVPGGFVGVDIFFVISGFVISAMLIRERRATGRTRFANFYLRRFKRLTPALAVMVAATVAVSAMVLSPLGIQQTAAQTGVGAMLLVANAVIARTSGGYFDADAGTNPLLHTWSLSVEEQFYLLFPALIAFGWYLASRRKAFNRLPFVLLTVVTVVSFGLACFGLRLFVLLQQHAPAILTPYTTVAQAAFGFYSPLTRSWEFAVGALLALAAASGLKWGRAGTAIGACGLALIAVSLVVISDTTPFPSVWTLVPVGGALLLLAAGCSDEASNTVSRLLSVGPLVKIGDWSYSIYLWHWPFIVFAAALWPDNRAALLIAAGLSFVPAVASYYWVEKPIRVQQFTGLRLVQVVATTILVPLCLALSVNFVANQGYWSPGVQAMQEAALGHHAMTDDCLAANLRPGEARSACQWNVDSAGKPIYLVGDSTAWHFSEAAIGASDSLKRPLTMIDVPGCPFKDVYVQAPHMAPDRDQKACRQLYESAMSWLVARPAGTVVIAELNGTYRLRDAAVGRRPQNLSSNPDDRTQALDQGLTSTIEELKQAGHSVLLVQAAPDFTYPVKFDPLRCTLGELQAGSCTTTIPRSLADSVQDIERSSVRTIAARTGSDIWDPRSFFCTNEECSTYRYGVNLYRDAFHISATASRMLAPSLADALNRMPGGRP
jgi:peptidoglycan/LPS O-acetylase OafA/YrhL